MKILLSIIITFLLIILQSSFYPYLNIYDAFPNLILILILILSILYGYKENLAWIIIGGFFLDVFSFNNPIGTSILCLLLVGYLVDFFSKNIFKKSNILSIIIIGIGGTLIYRFLLISILLITGNNFQFGFIQIISQMAYNLAVLIPLFYLIRNITKLSFVKS